MGQMEKEVKNRARRQNIQKIILGAISAAGVVSLALLAPNAVKFLRTLESNKTRKKNVKYSVNNAVSKLIENNLIYFEKTSKGQFIRLTEKGGQKLRSLEKYNFKINKPKKWDGKWRILIFDIKSSRNALRNKLRDTLKAVGFQKLQHSVWVYPYDCEDLIILLKADFMIGKDVLYIIADRIENDKKLKDNFGLKD